VGFKYRFTIFTSCYNSARFINRVYESLESQTFKNFEWLVIDDASEDNTRDIIRHYIKTASFPINFIEQPTNQMLTKNLNLGIELARGELMVLAGHDDRFDPETLEIFNDIWEELGNEKIAGIWCLCRDQNNNILGNDFSESVLISNYLEIFCKYIYRKEWFGCTRTAVLRQFPLDTSKLRYIPEDVLWGNIALYFNTIYVNKVLRTYYIESDNPDALTKSSRNRFADGIYYSYSQWINKFFYKLNARPFFRLKFLFAFSFYAVLNGIGIAQAIHEIDKPAYKMIVSILYPAAFILAVTLKLIKE
jgi:glycosyltransferase involved in cell wall biosynthesis